jgi:hypothetical protein
MTVTRIKVKVVRKAIVKVRVLPRVPANLFGDIAITVVKNGATYTIRPDYSRLTELTSFDPSQELSLVYNKLDATWAIVPVSTLVNNQAGTTQIVTAGASAVVGVNDKLVLVNKTAGSATTITLPVSSTKVGAVRIVDFKGDAGTNNITVNVAGSDKFNGNLTSWKIAGDGASILLTPISTGIGYAVS